MDSPVGLTFAELSEMTLGGELEAERRRLEDINRANAHLREQRRLAGEIHQAGLTASQLLEKIAGSKEDGSQVEKDDESDPNEGKAYEKPKLGDFPAPPIGGVNKPPV